MEKPKKTTAELTEIVMAEARKYPECDEVYSVAIIRPAGRSWDIAVTRQVSYVTPASLKRMDEIATQLRNQFDLA